MSTDICTQPDDTDDGMLPPYSAEEAVCPMCQNNEAFTWFRAALPPNTVQTDFNGTTRRGARPQRLERECARCTYKWDEALAVARPGMTIDALVYALDNSTPYPVELDAAVLHSMALRLHACLRITARPDHPLWQYNDGRPQTTATPQTPTCEETHATREDEEACEQARLTDSKESSR
ncbi:hypothetical protein DI272_19090 [Streptomyces sp. Act143]|uniref:hypothetical protein n=1 Tax=Streptomyces sp. Act143 TaxID=2200760 RepID=UPI000D67B6C4|nr:hypothetical protein [Streptomyces sp. Act143]PWI16038.1 hypothetical protein DI272_19090 [Streptomyces sp. Act143]